jgi:hypothetical protein
MLITLIIACCIVSLFCTLLLVAACIVHARSSPCNKVKPGNKDHLQPLLRANNAEPDVLICQPVVDKTLGDGLIAAPSPTDTTAEPPGGPQA